MQMTIENALWLNLAVALGIGLLIGAERERSKGNGPERSAAGIRTFTITTLLGAVSIVFNVWLLIASIFCVMIFAATAYYSKRTEDPGLTTEITLIFSVILGGLAMSEPILAAALAVSIAILLSAKEPMHGFVLATVTKDELNDFLILAAATLIILPLVPNAFVGPFEAINPRNLWLIVILIMTISALGHLALRWLGGRVGLPLVGLFSGFISSIATISAMGARVKESPHLLSATVAGAVLSSLATILQIAMLLLAIHPPSVIALQWPLIFGGLSIAIYGLIATVNCYHDPHVDAHKQTKTFSVKTALLFAAIIAIILIASAALNAWFGQAGLVVASGVAGLADVHAAVISITSFVASGKISIQSAVIPILVAFSVNTLVKAVIAQVTGGTQFARLVVPALAIQVAAVWLGWWLM
jgi:uncharacterized membrane protein (DUF4010 family)